MAATTSRLNPKQTDQRKASKRIMETSTFQEMARLEGEHWWFVARRQIVSQAIRSISLPEDAKVLEAGSGTGGNLAMLGQFGEVVGLEPSSLARSFAECRSDCTIVSGSLPFDLPFRSQMFELIVALDVLEHLDDDVTSLTELTRILRPGGFAVLTVPAFPFLWGPHDEAHHHRRRYRRNTLLTAVEESGLTPLHIGYFNTILFLPAAAIRLAKRALKRHTPDMCSLPWPPMNRMLTWLFGLERHLVPEVSLPFGLSLIVIAQKPSES